MRSIQLAIHEVPENPECPVVVVDVLRAFTTAAWVFDGGARLVALAATDDDALAIKHALGPDALAIKDFPQTEGFDLGNSPGTVRATDLSGRPVVLRTNNGTVGVHAARRAPLVLCGSLVNASATARILRDAAPEEVLYVITGRAGRAEEDIAGADLIHALTIDGTAPEGVAERVQQSANAHRLRGRLAAQYPGYHADDVELSAAIDVFDFAMVAQESDGLIVLERCEAPQ